MKNNITKITTMSDVGFRFGLSGRMPEPSEKRSLVRVSRCLALPFVVAAVLCFGIASSHAQVADNPQNLERLLRRYPDADANKDGKLTVEEANAYAAKMKIGKPSKGASAPSKDDPAPTKAGAAHWEATIKQFEATDAATPPPKGGVLLLGGSNARRWTDVSDYFPQHKVINRGFGGAKLTDVLYYTDRLVRPYAPKAIILNVGGNDLKKGETPEEIRDATRAFITKVHAALPETRIFCIGIPPTRNASTMPEGFKLIRSLSALIPELVRTEKNVEFIDLFPAFLDAKGQHRAELFVEDGTHFNADGYKTLTGLLRGKF